MTHDPSACGTGYASVSVCQRPRRHDSTLGTGKASGTQSRALAEPVAVKEPAAIKVGTITGKREAP